MEQNKNNLQQNNKFKNTVVFCLVVCKVAYVLCIVACAVFAILTPVLAINNAIGGLVPAETAILFGGLTLYLFLFVNLFWNACQIFEYAKESNNPFCERVVHYTKKFALATIVVSIVPAIVCKILLKLFVGESVLHFDIQFVGEIVGLILLILCEVVESKLDLKPQENTTAVESPKQEQVAKAKSTKTTTKATTKSATSSKPKAKTGKKPTAKSVKK